VWHLYQYYEDHRILKENYASMKKMVDHFTSVSEGHLIKEGYYGDHMLPGDSPGNEEFHSTETARPLLRTGHYYRDVSIISQAAGVLGKTEDGKTYAALADKIREAINNEWLDKAKCQYDTGSQTANLFPLALGIVPEDCKEGMLKNVTTSIMESYDGHLHTGNIGTTSMIEVLVPQGLGDVMYAIATATSYPGWGHMVAEGATTLWEAWGKRNDLGSGAESMVMWCMIDEFFFNSLAGIQGPSYYGPGSVSPGFREICIKPHVLGDLKQASASFKTVRGMVRSSWEKKHDSLRLEVALPVNSQGAVRVPKMGLRNVAVTEGGHLIWKAGAFVKGVPGIYAGKEDGEYVTLRVGSGRYVFDLTGGHE